MVERSLAGSKQANKRYPARRTTIAVVLSAPGTPSCLLHELAGVSDVDSRMRKGILDVSCGCAVCPAIRSRVTTLFRQQIFHVLVGLIRGCQPIAWLTRVTPAGRPARPPASFSVTGCLAASAASGCSFASSLRPRYQSSFVICFSVPSRRM